MSAPEDNKGLEANEAQETENAPDVSVAGTAVSINAHGLSQPRTDAIKERGLPASNG